jgi:hypothetical protein
MTRPLLPPRGVFVPSALIYDQDLPPAARDTWIQLRGLAWGRQETPALSFIQLAGMLGKKRSTLYEHMRLLRARGALRWRPGSTSEIIVVFPQDEELYLSGFLEKPNPPPEGDINTTQRGDNFSAVRNSGKADRGKWQGASASAAALKSLVDSLAEATGMRAELNYPRLARSARKLQQCGYTAEQIARLYGARQPGVKTAWYERDWRGKRGQRPTPEQIEETIAGLSAPEADPSSRAVLRRLAEKEGIDFDEL